MSETQTGDAVAERCEFAVVEGNQTDVFIKKEKIAPHPKEMLPNEVWILHLEDAERLHEQLGDFLETNIERDQ